MSLQLLGLVLQHCGRCEACGVQFTDAECLADTDLVTGHDDARLLLFGVDWCVWIADAMATVCAERRP